MAAVDVPSAWIVGRIADATEQKAVKAILDEFRTTGQVVHNVSPEIRAVANAKPPSTSAATRKDEPVPQVQALREPDQSAKDSPVQTVVLPADALSAAVPERVVPVRIAPERVPETTGPVARSSMALAAVDQAAEVGQKSEEESSRNSYVDPSPKVREVEPQDEANSEAGLREPRVSLDSDLVDAPSIGPKTAAKFYAIGINTIGDFVVADPEAMAVKLNTKWIDARTLVDWQDQAKLIVQVAALCGYKAQLLVGAEYRSANELAEAEVDSLHEAVSRYADTNVGARILRSAAKPSRDEIAKWVESAKLAQPLVHSRAA